MSMSTQHGGGGTRRTSAVSTGSPGKKSSDASKSTASKASTASKKTAPAKGGGPRKPITPVKVGQSRNWGPIALFVAVGLLAAAIIGYGGYYVYKSGQGWQDRASAIDGIVDYREDNPEMLKYESHQDTPVKYQVTPPVGGTHNNAWQRCFGDVYDAPIASEHAVHSLEHGAVWITYRPDLPADQVEKLAARVRGNDYRMMSPFEGLDKPISLQAWGYQLKVDNADDPRIDAFINELAQNASMEAGVTCSQGNYVTATGTEPRVMQPDQPQPGTGG